MIDEGTKSYRGSTIFPRSHSWQVVEPEFNPRQSVPESALINTMPHYLLGLF